MPQQENAMMDVYALGSCRLRAPLLHLHRAGRVRFCNVRASWYAHNSAECLQRIAMTDGEMPLPEGLRPLILNRNSCPQSWEEGVAPIPEGALGMFEIATRMQRRLDPFVLHSTCIRRTGFTGARDHLMSWEELEADIAALAARFARVILLGNIALAPDLRRPEPGRLALNRHLQRIAGADARLSYVSPNEHISPADPASDLVDHNHFTPAFERRMADVLLQAIGAAAPALAAPAIAPGTRRRASLSPTMRPVP